jgi:Putative small multi-drug export protein.
MTEQLIEQLGLLGVFLAGATPFLEALIVVPVAIVLGLDPVITTVVAVAGNVVTIGLFALSSRTIMGRIVARRHRRGLPRYSASMQRGMDIFEQYGVWSMAVLGPLVIGTQIGAAIAVSLGITPARATVIVSVATALWAVLAAIATLAITG